MITLSQTAPWNPELTNPYRTRWAAAGGRYFKVSAETMTGTWDVDEVSAAGEWLDYWGCALTLAEAREAIERAVS